MQGCLKKISAWLLVVCVLISQTGYVFAQESYSAPTLSVSTVTVEGGGTVDITVTMHNNPGIVSMQLDVEYDSSVLTLTNVTDCGLIGTAVHSNNLSLCPYRLTWANDLSLTNYTDNGVIVTLTFTVAENAAAGEYPVAVTYTKNNFEIFDKDANEIDFDLVSGFVMLKAAQCAHTDKTKASAKAADCVNTGNNMYYVCNDCGVVLKADGVTETIVEAETIPALGHDLSEATCGEPAACRRECCGYTEGSAKGHAWSEKIQDAAHLVPGSGENCQNVKQYYYDCAHCNAIGTEIWDSTDVGGHKLSDTWQSENGEHYHVCTVEECDYAADKSACAGGTMTCEEKAVCSVCGKPYGKLAPHALEEVPSKSPDCEHSGNHMYYVCGVCGDVYKADGVTQTTVEAETIPALGHSYNTNVIASTCTEQGYTTHTCSNCGDVYVDSYVNALGHSFTKYTSNGDATCVADGTKTAKCDRCDGTDTVTDVGSATGHTMGEWYETKAPTCTEEGTEQRDCANCDHYETRQIDAKGHSYTEKVTAPTCTEKGHTTHTCACGASYVDTYTPALGHDYGEWYQTKAPTLKAEGEERRDCSRCDEYQTRKLPMLVHSYTSVITEPTCTERGYTTHTCANCGDAYVDSYVNALGHSFTKYTSNGDATCVADGTKTAKCDRCDGTDTVTDVGSATGHTMGEWYETKAPTCTEEGTEQRDCAKCDHYETREIDAKGHSYTEKVKTPTCTEQGYTTHTCKCGDSYIDSYTEAAGHSWNSGVVTKEPTESKEGIRTYSCAACGEERTEPIPALEHKHSYTAVVTAPTCTDNGYTTHTCACGDSYVDAYTAALGHAWDEGVVSVEPTDETEGVRLYSCSHCDAEKSEPIHYLNPDIHNYGYSVVVTEATCYQDGYTTYTCYCGASYVDDRIPSHVINPFDDNFGDKFYEKLIKATCTESGGIFYICRECGESILYAYMEAKGHDLGEWEIVKQPNYLENGLKERHCSRCGVFESEEINNNPFVDVKADRFETAILWAYYNGITTGTGDGTTFSPENACTRKQIVTFLWRAAGEPEPKSMENPFTDVKADRFEKAILWAYYEGITTGTGDGTTFSPEATCTRKQIVTFLWRYHGKPAPESSEITFTDVKNDRFAAAILWAAEQGITTGTGDGSIFSPEAPCTRKQIVTFLYRLLEEE